MIRGIGRGAPLVTFCLSLFLPGAPSAAPPSAAPPSPPSPSPAPLGSTTLTATVQSIDAQAGTLEVVTGVGYALRVLKLSWKAAPTVKAAASGAGLSQVKPGDLVRVQYAKTTQGNVLSTIELLPPPPAVR
jgi:hypothetical protein